MTPLEQRLMVWETILQGRGTLINRTQLALVKVAKAGLVVDQLRVHGLVTFESSDAERAFNDLWDALLELGNV